MNMTSHDAARKKAFLQLIVTALLWSLGGLLIKWVNWPPLAIAGMRSAIAAVLMVLWCRPLRFNWSFPQLGGAAAYAATVILFVTANKMTTAANAILLQYTAPVYVGLFGWWFLGEKTTKLDWLTIAFTLGGMVLFFQDNLTVGNMFGNLVAIGSGVAFAGLAMFTRKQKDGSSLESMLLGNILTALIGFPFMLGSSPGTQGWIGLVLLGVFQLGLSYILYSKAMKYLTALEGILIPVLEPVLNPVWVFIFLGEKPGPWALVGGLVILITVTARCVIGEIQSHRR